MWNVLLPAVVLPALLFAVLYAYPFAEQWLTGERRHEHHLCDRPRERPVRTGLGVAGIVFYGVLTLAGGNDVIAATFQISVNALTWVLRVSLVLLPGPSSLSASSFLQLISENTRQGIQLCGSEMRIKQSGQRRLPIWLVRSSRMPAISAESRQR